MAIKSFKDWRILPKIIGAALLGVALLAAVVLFYFLPMVEKQEMESRKRATRQSVELAFGIVGAYEARIAAGELTVDEAKERAAADIKKLRYAKKEYFWINDSSARLVAHPLRPENEGKDMGDFKDADGKLIYREFAKAAGAENGELFVDYRQIKPNEKTPLPKVSFVKYHKPWDWVIGTGIYVDDVKRDIAMLRWKIIGAIVVAGAVACLLVLFAGVRITRPLKVVVSSLEDIAQGEGDLTRRIDVVTGDEVGDLGRAFNQFIEKLHNIISQVVQNSMQVASAAAQIHSTSEQTATGAEEVAAQAGTVATAGEEMASTSSEIARNCMAAAENSRQANDTALKGSHVVKETLTVMTRIADRVKESAHTVESLGSRSDQIGEIVGTIQDIADQTNLLALNAAIEAARAGEQGRGFAVVADEVRALAERTTKATKEIGQMIRSIQQETKLAVSSMEEGVKEVERGTSEAAKSGEALEEILHQIGEVTNQVNQIATAAEQQTATTSEISSNIHEITEVITQTTRGAQDSASATSDLARLAEELQRLVGQFRLS
ncbi:methyl-accepting chemotaxis protein [Geobacter sulfurreducens]|uniref:methyl-accepting chemotaxis protein n=1 Tax=Geobacter sulfurreducens TaxID=35554 RepID=UPI0001D8F522|nr:methyl-accepting chemotaxis protein [Geobacter sulfurreducens]ADI83871.1 methyl-accepting chemotaxis sensory transducer, class 40H, Cache_2 domain-containing [Geobacter sulfurreducens KN400]QVW36267.1 methyl-accepting chemotaxis protein [Geobacter sulfurreducens]UTG93715.1 methyl-accepting chemotaxis protein [Geobacter sulfurreducens]